MGKGRWAGRTGYMSGALTGSLGVSGIPASCVRTILASTVLTYHPIQRLMSCQVNVAKTGGNGQVPAPAPSLCLKLSSALGQLLVGGLPVLSPTCPLTIVQVLWRCDLTFVGCLFFYIRIHNLI